MAFDPPHAAPLPLLHRDAKPDNTTCACAGCERLNRQVASLLAALDMPRTESRKDSG